MTESPVTSVKVKPPAGWLVKGIELTSSEGQATLSLRVAGVEADTFEGVMLGEAARRAQDLSGYAEEPLAAIDTEGGPVLLQRYSWQESGGARREGVTLARLVAGSPYVAVLDTPDRADDNDLQAAAEALGTLVVGDDSPTDRDFSIEELAALAELAGEKSFPGTGEFQLRGGEQRSAAQRSLLARGTLLAIDEAGRAYVHPTDAEIIATSLHPSAVVEVQHARAGRLDRLFMYVSPKTSVAHRAGMHGIHRLGMLSTPRLGMAVASFTGLREDGADPGEPIAVPTSEFARLRDAAADGRLAELDAGALGEVMTNVASSTQVRVVAAAEGAVPDTELLWLESPEHRLWLVDPHGDSVAVSPTTLEELSHRFEQIWRPLLESTSAP